MPSVCTQGLNTKPVDCKINNFTTVWMVDVLTAFNVVKLLRINPNLVNIP